MRTSSRRLAENLLLSLASVSVLLLVAELAARALAPPLLPVVRFSRSHCWQRSALLGHENAPHCTGRDGDATVRINSLGLRGAELQQGDRVRILALGDSCTFGQKVDESTSYPAVLQRLLDERGGPTRYEVMNAGVEGHTSLQGLIYLRERGLVLRPAIVIFGYGFNDTLTDGSIADWIPRQRRFLAFFTVSDWLSERSTLWLWMLSGNPPRDRRQRVTPAEFEANVRQIVRLTRGHGAKPLALSFVMTQMPPYESALKNAVEPLGVPIVVYDGLTRDTVHPTIRGYSELAEHILRRLEDAGYLEGVEGPPRTQDGSPAAPTSPPAGGGTPR